MDKKKKRQLLQTREDCIAQLYQGIKVLSSDVFSNNTFFKECLSVKEINKWSQFEPIYEKLQKVIEIEKGEKDNISFCNHLF
jgi:hypothetical protein